MMSNNVFYSALQVIFSTRKDESYEKFDLKQCVYNEKYNIFFENVAIQEAFEKLLRYECQLCLKQKSVEHSRGSKKAASIKNSSKNDLQLSPESSVKGKDRTSKQTLQDSSTSGCIKEMNQSGQKDEKNSSKWESSSVGDRIEEDAQGLLKPSDVAHITHTIFSDVLGLKNHLNYVHRLKLCELCLTHNKLFPFEYSYYDRAALDRHKAKGEPKTSHRGHPNCELCRLIFFNTDELIAHMSREHFHCHLCGRHDSVNRVYFADYTELRKHFKDKHFLCEREHCRFEQFISAFDTSLDFQLHLVQVHGNPTSGLSRGEARHQRTITLDSAPHRARPISPSRSFRQNLPRNAAVVSTGTVATANNSRHPLPESFQAQIIQQRLPTRAEFPALGQNSTSSSTNYAEQQSLPPTYNTSYPSLAQTNSDSSSNPIPTSRPSTTTCTTSLRIVAGPSSSRPSFVRTLGGGYQPPEQLNEMDFPPLPEHPKPKSKSKKPKAQDNASTRNTNGGLTLNQLFSSSLTMSNRNSKTNGKKANTKGNPAKSNKNVKPKAIKIQLS